LENKPYILVLLVLIIINTGTLAQDIDRAPIFYGEKTGNYPAQLLKNKFRKFTGVKIASKEIFDYCKNIRSQKKSLQLRLASGLNFDLELESSNIVPANYMLRIQTPDGIKTLESNPDFLYKGKTKLGGEVRLAIKEGFISGSISDSEKEYFIEPMKHFYKQANADEFIIYEPSDLIDTSFRCGFTDAGRTAFTAIQENANTALSTEDNGCKKIKFVMVADFSMYEKFNYDVNALEAEFLADLNAAEVFFTGFNFNTGSLSDEGTDMVKFEGSQIIVSTCKSCDVIANPSRAVLAFNSFLPWIKQNISIQDLQIHQYWTAKDLDAGTPVIGLAGSESYAGCSNLLMQLHHFGGGVPVLRIQIAHETGHNLGCLHDNFVNSSVRSFIMNSGLVISATRFSQLRDFGGIKYSSNLAIRDTIQPYVPCISDCAAPPCELITGLKIDSSYRGEGIKVIWDGAGQFTIKYKLQQAAGFDSSNIKIVTENSIILKNLDPCSAYVLQVQKRCTGGQSVVTGINFSPFYFIITEKSINQRGELYDLQVQIEKIADKARDVYLKVDHKGSYVKMAAGQTEIILNNLFADGARHRLDVLLDTNSNICKRIVYYKAPYYRADSKKLANADFNDCSFPQEWKDSVHIKAIPGYSDPYYAIANLSSANSIQLPGNLDNTCMLFYDNFNQRNIYNGVLSLISPVLDITGVKDPLLSFDYKFLSYGKKGTTGYIPTYFKILAFNGNIWEEIFRLENDENFSLTVLFRDIWDTIPSRVFIPLKNYSNNKFQLQFVLDDASRAGAPRPYFFIAIDNILLDGYPVSTTANQVRYHIFPNPSKDIIFIKGLPLGQTFDYRITDAFGRVVKKGQLENYNIDISNFPPGVFLLTFFQNGTKEPVTLKFVKM
jgi:Secretion system C-terminal sorting domain